MSSYFSYPFRNNDFWFFAKKFFY